MKHPVIGCTLSDHSNLSNRLNFQLSRALKEERFVICVEKRADNYPSFSIDKE